MLFISLPDWCVFPENPRRPSPCPPDLQPLWVSLQIGAALSSRVGVQKNVPPGSATAQQFYQNSRGSGSTFSKYRQNTTILKLILCRKSLEKSRNFIRLSVQYTIGQIGDICTNLRKNPWHIRFTDIYIYVWDCQKSLSLRVRFPLSRGNVPKGQKG